MERKTKEFVCECSEDMAIVVAEGDVGQCGECGKEFSYHYESMETMYQDLLAYRKLANKNWNHLSDISIKLNNIFVDILDNKPYKEIRFNVMQLREMASQHTMTGMNELQFFYGKNDCEDCE